MSNSSTNYVAVSHKTSPLTLINTVSSFFQRLGLRYIAQRNLERCFNLVRVRRRHCFACPPVHRLYEHRRGPGSLQLRRPRRSRRVHSLRLGSNTNWRHYCRRLRLRRRLWRLYFLNLLPARSTKILDEIFEAIATSLGEKRSEGSNCH